MKMNDWEEDPIKKSNEIDEGPDEADADLLDEDRIELVPCPHCGAAISEFAQQCPQCKYWITKEPALPFSGRSLWWIVLAVTGIAMFVLLYAL